MSITRGGLQRRKRFKWQLNENKKTILVENEQGKKHHYSIMEISNILRSLYQQFKNEYFPLANNVEWLANGTEKPGLGMTILSFTPNDVYHAQGASYLGVILEECGYLEWNGASRGIMWKLKNFDFEATAIEAKLILAKTAKS